MSDLCTANVTSAAFVRTQVAAKRMAKALISPLFYHIFFNGIPPPGFTHLKKMPHPTRSVWLEKV